MKAILEFDLDNNDYENDEERLQHAIHADDMYYVLWEFLHNWGRHRDLSVSDDSLLAEIKGNLTDELSARGVVMD